MPLQRYKRILFIAIPIIIVGFLIVYFKEIFSYVLLGWVLSLLGAPIFKLVNKVLSPSISAIISLFCILLILVTTFYIIVPPVIQQTRHLAELDYEKMFKQFEEPLNDWKQWMINKGLISSDDIFNTGDSEAIKKNQTKTPWIGVDSVGNNAINVYVNIDKDILSNKDKTDITSSSDSMFSSIQESLKELFNPAIIGNIFSSVAGFFGNFIITLFSAFFIAFFFLKQQGLFTQIIKDIIPNEYEDQAAYAISDSEKLLVRYFVGILIQVLLISTFLTIALKLLGIQHAMLIAFVAALLNLIPYLGPLLGGLFGIFIILSSNIDQSIYDLISGDVLKVIVVFGLMQLIDNFLFQPNIFSKSVKSHPLEIFIVVLIGAKLGGVAGMILAIPMYTILRVLAKVFFSEFKIVQSITRNI